MLREIEESTRPVPPLVKIKVGIKKTTQKGTEYPEEVEYFFINPLEQAIDRRGRPILDDNGEPIMNINPNAERLIRMLGTDKPRKLDIVFPTDNLDMIIPTYRFWWKGGSAGSKLLCKGDGYYAQYRGEQVVPGMLNVDHIDGKLYKPGEGWNRECNPATCPQAQPFGKKPPLCKPTMTIKCMIPSVFKFGFVSISTSSPRAAADVYNTLKYYKNPNVLKKLGLKSFVGIPMTLTRVPANNREGNGKNFLIRVTINEDRLEQELELYRLGKPSTFDAIADREAVALIENSEKDVPDYDLLPQSEHGMVQTGDYVIDAKTNNIVKAHDTAPMKVIQEETPTTIRQQWLNDNPDLNTLFNKVAKITGKHATQKKKELTLMRFETVEDARDYLQSIIDRAEASSN